MQGTSSVKFEVELPQDLVLALDISPTDLGTKAREWIVLQLFQEGIISGGRAAEILGMRKVDFMGLVDFHGLPYLDSSREDLEGQLHVALEASHDSGAK